MRGVNKLLFFSITIIQILMAQKSKKIGIELDDYKYVEVLDRLKIVIDNIDNYITQHPVLKLETEANKKVAEGSDALWKAYQLLKQIKGIYYPLF